MQNFKNNPLSALSLKNVVMQAAMAFEKDCVFDMHITDTGSCSILAAREKEKKDKYLQKCHEERKDFRPLVYLVDCIAGREVRNAECHLATYLADKWNK